MFTEESSESRTLGQPRGIGVVEAAVLVSEDWDCVFGLLPRPSLPLPSSPSQGSDTQTQVPM